MPVLNITRKTWLASHVRKADNFLTRLVGLLRRKRIGREEALWLVPSKGIHTFGMKFPIDVVFLDRSNRVIALEYGFAPQRVSRIFLRARSVLELPSGTLRKSDTVIGDQLEILMAEASALDDLKETMLNQDM